MRKADEMDEVRLDIDRKLLAEARRACGCGSDRETVEAALLLMLRRRAGGQGGSGAGRLEKFRGRIWQEAADMLARERREWDE